MKLRVKELCKQKGLTITELAKKMDIKQESLSRIINGNPTVSSLEKIANTLEVSIVELFEEKKDGFTALIDNNGVLYRVNDTEELKKLISELENNK